MKRRIFLGFLVCEAVLFMFLYLSRQALPRAFTAVMAFPFEQLGLGLRFLSLLGGIGNAISILLYLVLSLIPAGVLLLIGKKRRYCPEDALLAILSGVLFFVLYLMINPGFIGTYTRIAAGQKAGKAFLGGMIYSILIGYVILRILRQFYRADLGKLQYYMRILLYGLNGLFVLIAFGAQFGSLLDAYHSLRTGNVGNEHILGMSYVFLTLQYLVNVLPYLLNIFVVFAALDLLEAMKSDRSTETTVTAAEGLSRLCGKALAVTVVSNLGFNLLQLIFIQRLMVVHGSVQIPLLSIAFVLAVLLLAQYIIENKRLKDANDLFI